MKRLTSLVVCSVAIYAGVPTIEMKILHGLLVATTQGFAAYQQWLSKKPINVSGQKTII
jgi:hypothetical protein